MDKQAAAGDGRQAASRAVAHSSDKVDKLRDISKNALDLLMKVLGNPVGRSLQIYFAASIGPVELQHSLDAKHVKDREELDCGQLTTQYRRFDLSPNPVDFRSPR